MIKMQKLRGALALLVLLALLPLGALAEGIAVGRSGLQLNADLDKNVTNILVLLQDGDVTDTMMIASINSRTGRAVMARVLDYEVEVQELDGALTSVNALYAMGDAKSKGYLVCRELNETLGLNLSTYLALDISRLPELAEQVGALNMQLDEAEAEALGAWAGINELTGDAVLAYVRLRLDSDDPTRSRGYDALMQLLYQGLHSGDLMGMMGLGSKLLSSMDTNLNVMTALTLASAVQAGTDRRELTVDVTMQGEEAVEILYREIYE